MRSPWCEGQGLAKCALREIKDAEMIKRLSRVLAVFALLGGGAANLATPATTTLGGGQAPVALGSAANFAVLAGSTVTNTVRPRSLGISG